MHAHEASETIDQYITKLKTNFSYGDLEAPMRPKYWVWNKLRSNKTMLTLLKRSHIRQGYYYLHS